MSIVEAFNSNNQLYDSFYLNRGRMVTFMNRVTDREYRLASGKLSTRPAKAKVLDDEIPF